MNVQKIVYFGKRKNVHKLVYFKGNEKNVSVWFEKHFSKQRKKEIFTIPHQ